MHDLLRKFCLIEAENIKFIHVERTDQVLPLPTQKHNVRRFSFQTRFCVDEHCCKPLPLFTRSIYIFSPSKYVCFSRLNLLRVLAFPTTHLDLSPYPLDITHLSHLRYLEVLRWTSLPASISELQNLQTLIQQDPYRNEYATLPGTIWLMKNLRHVNLGGSSYLPSPRSESIQNKQLEIGMPNLEELSGVCSRSCANEVFSDIPNLKRLIIHVNYLKVEFLANRLIDMSSLTKLEALKCFCGNLRAKNWPLSMKRFVFPTSLTRLTLTGFEFTWEDISTLVMLPNLEELKLKHYSVVDEEWRLSDEDKFKSLKLLLFSSLDIQRWEASSDSFPNLKCLVLKYCRFVEAIPADFMDICTLESIELHDCSTTAGDSARKIKEEQDQMGNNFLNIYVHDQCKCLSKGS